MHVLQKKKMLGGVRSGSGIHSVTRGHVTLHPIYSLRGWQGSRCSSVCGVGEVGEMGRVGGVALVGQRR